MQSGGEILVRSLINLGAQTSFGVPGESYLPVLDALHDTAGQLDFVLCRNEGGAAYMAAAYGKLTATPGLCWVTRGPGATNASIGPQFNRAAVYLPVARATRRKLGATPARSIGVLSRIPWTAGATPRSIEACAGRVIDGVTVRASKQLAPDWARWQRWGIEERVTKRGATPSIETTSTRSCSTGPSLARRPPWIGRMGRAPVIRCRLDRWPYD